MKRKLKILTYALVLAVATPEVATGLTSPSATPLEAPAPQTKKGAKKSNKKGKAATNKTTSAKNRNASEVKKQQSNNARQQQETREKIKANSVETEKRLNQLNLVEGEISQCNSKISDLSIHIDSLNRETEGVNDSIAALDKRLKGISERYASSLRKTQGKRQQTSELAFIFSSESFTQAYRRLRALRQFDKWRQRKAAEINDVRRQLDERKNALTSLKKQTASSIGKLNNEKSVLMKKQSETASLVNELRSERSELSYIMERQRRQARELDDELDRIIAEEQRRAAEQEKQRKEEEARKAAEAKARQEAERKAEEQRIAAERKRKEQEALAEARAKEKADKEAALIAENKRKEQERKSEPAKPAKASKESAGTKARQENAKEKKAESKKNKEKGKKSKPVKHTGKNNRREQNASSADDKLLASASKSESKEASGNIEETAPTLRTPTAGGTSGVAGASTVEARDFADLKGRLPFPVTGNYTIVKRFGKQKHPKLPYVETVCSGIEIETSSGAAARAVFDGEVSAILHPEGNNTVVVIRHGKNYLTVYSNLSSSSVSPGQKIKAGQTIGNIFADPNDGGRSVLHFEIRNQRQKENPELWLRR